MALPEGVATAALDALLPHIAVLDASGDILWTNRSWRAFGAENAAVSPEGNVGENYFEQCVDDDPHAEAACAGLRELAGGDRESFQLEYPCHSPAERRWFVLYGSRFDVGGDRYLVTAHTDVTDRKIAELELERRIDTAESVARMLSHDLRNPLTVALGRIELAAEERPSEDLDTALSALHRVETMIADAVTFVRIGATALDRESVSLEAVAREAWSHVATGDATLTVATDLTLSAHPGLLAHLFENLFRNSVEHAGPAPAVRVGTLDDGTGFVVEDDGSGVPEPARESVFELDSHESGDRPSFGLPIVDAVVDAHGWEISITDAAGGGARFEVRTAPATPDPL
ncbi:MAG: ATP-binding protein [Halobacteriaceae archaeon]